MLANTVCPEAFVRVFSCSVLQLLEILVRPNLFLAEVVVVLLEILRPFFVARIVGEKELGIWLTFQCTMLKAS